MAVDPSLKKLIASIAKQYGIPANIYLGLIQQESGFNQGSRSGAGAIGYAQLMPGTARGLHVDPYNGTQNLIGGAKYLRQQLDAFGGDISKALAAYNAGPGAVRKYGGIPPYAETQNYVQQVLKYARQFSGAGGSVSFSGLDAAGVPAPQLPMPSFVPVAPPDQPMVSPNMPKFGVGGTSISSPFLTIKPFPHPMVQPTTPGVSEADATSGSFGQDSGPSSVGYPLARHGKLIGTPFSGTHTIGNWQSDNAVDIAIPIGTPVYAVTNGVIGSRIGSLGKGGRFAGLRLTLSGGGNAYFYQHLEKLLVRAGQRVRAGQLLGYSGSANGVAHLHFGVEHGNPVKLLGY